MDFALVSTSEQRRLRLRFLVDEDRRKIDRFDGLGQLRMYRLNVDPTFDLLLRNNEGGVSNLIGLVRLWIAGPL